LTELEHLHMPKTLQINGDRLWQRLNDMAAIGATPKGGVCRLALTETDRAGRDLFVSWCKQAGCSVSVDQIGNIFARRPGRKNELPPVLTGSHLDSQPTGGRFDGTYGVLAGLEVIETLNDQRIETDAPLEIVVWTNEEGARFNPALTGSGVYAGEFDLHQTLKISDRDGLELGAALARIGYAGPYPATAKPIKAALEAHIEQGPILEKTRTSIGIVTGVQGMKWCVLTITGAEVHAGPTPMEDRRDPVLGLTRILDRLYKLISSTDPSARITIGQIETTPGVVNTVPGQVRASIDIRHPDQGTLEGLFRTLNDIVAAECTSIGLNWQVEETWNSPALSFAPECINAVRQAACTLNYPMMEIVSGAGHDAVYLSRVAPTGMIFIPCEKGISHNEAENISKTDAISGCNVLLHALLALAEVDPTIESNFAI
jgi:N-carbamoyl-L-amino-acid hydrolase